jgi:Protein of unknown function (DUF616)
MKICILTANLGNFDTPVNPVDQKLPEDSSRIKFQRYTDLEFPPITGLTPRLQYRIPKMFGWQMHPGFDYYIWLDGSVTFKREDCAQWFLDQLGDADMALFKHPFRNTIQEEVDHIEDHLQKGKPYITSRYKNGLHKEQFADILLDQDYIDDKLYTSTAFIYKDSGRVRDALRIWWLHQSRYFTCDQVALPYAVKDLDVNMINENQWNTPYLTVVSRHS